MNEDWTIAERENGTFLLREKGFEGGGVYSSREAAEQCLKNFTTNKKKA